MSVDRAGFIGDEGQVFARHHVPCDGTRRRNAGIVLCPPFGYEHVSSYRTFRLLATQLANAGFDVLRIDYQGTGNSAADRATNPIDAWRGSIELAIDELTRVAESTHVALIGFRLGALLALDAAARRPVDRLVLWHPFASGRSFVRELRAFARLSRQDHASEETEEGGINAAGYLLSTSAIAAIERWTPVAVPSAPAREVLLVHSTERAIDTAVGARLEDLGAAVTTVRVEGTEAMLATAHKAKVPREVVAAITRWFGEWQTTPSPSSTIATLRMARSDGDCCERPVRFGPDGRLFGMVSQPRVDTTLPAIVLFNTGAEHHIGPHRLYVPLAREWAAQGHHVLRYDLGGIGDSAPPAGAAENIAYPSHMLEDAREAVAFIRELAPNRPVIVAGLCSGGWLAFRAARDGLDVDAVVSVNPPLYLRDSKAGAQWLSEADELDRYQRSLRDPSKWAKALRGEASYTTFTRLAAGALQRKVAARIRGGDEGVSTGLADDLQTIAQRRIRSLFVFSRGDDGLDYFQRHAAPALERDDVASFIRHVVVDGAGHSFRPRAAQRTLRERLVEFVGAVSNVNAQC